MTDTSQFHAYSDGTDTIIGTSLTEARIAYAEQIGLSLDDISVEADWRVLDDCAKKTIRLEDECFGLPAGRTAMTYRQWIDWHINCLVGWPQWQMRRMTYRQWIDWHINSAPENFSRLLCSAKY